MNTRKMRNTKGITLVALIVTIIVLLILAGISLNLIMGEKGITQRAVNAGKVHNISGAKEKLELKIADYAGEYYQAKYVNRIVNANDVGTYVLGKFSPEETTFEENYYLKKENSKLILTSRDRTTTATCTVDSNGKVEWEGTEIDDDSLQTTYTWTQYAEEGETAKIWVTNGDVTLEVGQAVTGYSVTATVDGEEKTFSDWYVLGAEDGKLLITMNKNPEKVSLEGRDGYTEGLTILNDTTVKYCSGDFGDSVRTIKVDDINRITGYKPETVGFNRGALNEYGNEVTYYWDGTNKPYYLGSNSKEGNLTNSHYTAFYYLTSSGFTNSEIPSDSENISITNLKLITTLTSTGYSYDTSTYLSSTSLEYLLLFGNSGDYWLGSQYVICYDNRVDFDFGQVWINSAKVGYSCLTASDGDTSNSRAGLRPVVYLKSSVKVTSEGVISNN